MYIGSQWRVHAPNNCVNTYQTDESGKIEYLFDEFGYRQTACNSNASLNVYVSGCSLTFGVGLAECDTWPAILANRLRDLYGVSICYRNFAQGGASNAYIARSLIMESYEDAPDVIIAQLTYKNRAEYNGAETPGEMIGPWSEQDYALHYYAYYTDREGVISSLKNLLLLQLFCETRGIRFYFCTEDSDIVDSKWPGDNEVSRGLKGMLKLDQYVHSKLWRSNPQDLAQDGWHPGREAQLHHAVALENVLSKSSPTLFGERLST